MTATEYTLYLGYLVWLTAGCIDFACHRRADLAHTSGLAESRLHLLQMALIGGMLIAWMLWAPSLGLLSAMAGLVLAHAVVGYLDTRVAWRRRPITPLEQHIHSVLDAAPWACLAVAVHRDGAAAIAQGGAWSLRAPAVSAAVWGAVLLPAAALCVLPLCRELWTAWRAARPRSGP